MKKHALTLVEVVVTLLIVAVLFALVMISLKGRRRPHKGAGCLSNLKQIALACHLYSQDYVEYFPMATGTITDSNQSLYLLLPNYMTTTRPFVCPQDRDCRAFAKDMTTTEFLKPHVNSYAFVAGMSQAMLSDSPLGGDNLKDASKTDNLSYQQFRAAKGLGCSQGGHNHGSDGSNVVFVDGHAEFNTGTKLRIRWLDNANSTKNVKNPNGIKDGT